MSGELLATIATGSRADSDAAFAELVSVWQQPLTGYAYKVLRSWDQAEDVFQSVMLTVFQHAGNYRDTSFSGWLYTLTERRCLDVIRKRKNDPLANRVTPSDELDPLAAIAETHRPAIDLIVEREELDEIAAAMDAIPDDQRAVLELFNEGYSFGEISDASGVNHHTTKRRAQLARQKTLGRAIDAKMVSLVEKMFS